MSRGVVGGTENTVSEPTVGLATTSGLADA